MKKHPLIAATFLVHAVAWFLPVAKDGVTFPDGLPGWQAFIFALLGSKGPPWWVGALSAMSALSTALFVLGAGWVMALGTAKDRRVLPGSPRAPSSSTHIGSASPARSASESVTTSGGSHSWCWRLDYCDSLVQLLTADRAEITVSSRPKRSDSERSGGTFCRFFSSLFATGSARFAPSQDLLPGRRKKSSCG